MSIWLEIRVTQYECDMQSRVDGHLLLDPTSDESYRGDAGCTVAMLPASNKVVHNLCLLQSCYGHPPKIIETLLPIGSGNSHTVLQTHCDRLEEVHTVCATQ